MEPTREHERELAFIGGPLDGARYWQPKAFVPAGIYYPNPQSDRVGSGVWCGETVPVDRERGHYRFDRLAPCEIAGAFPLRWIAPGEWTGPAWTCGQHGTSGMDRRGCDDCARDKYYDE
jgi:hypothetical protein